MSRGDDKIGRGILNLIHKFASKFMCGISLDLLSLSKHKSTTFVVLLCFGGGRGIRTPVGLPPNGFQDFLTNPTLTQNNRKYQTIENAENPVNSRAFGVLSFPKSKTSSSARISASKTVSKDFLEKSLDKTAPNSHVASHNL